MYGWPLNHRLPEIPAPLPGGDPDASLDLQVVFNSVYDRAGYDYAIDYSQDVSPTLSESEREWTDNVLANRPK